MRRITWIALMALGAAMLAIGPAAADDDDGDDGGAKTWRVTITNIAQPGSQPLSPPLVAVHSSKADVWSVGDIASHGVAAIAEDANNDPLLSALPQLPGFKSVANGTGAPIGPGASASFNVTSEGRFNRLSIVTMLVNTNDAFTGLDSLRLRGNGETRETMAYDGGSELNNELASHIPGPCCGHMFVRAPEGQPVKPHAGILGGGDLSIGAYDWNGAVARIAIARVP
jgi:Spondin_N